LLNVTGTVTLVRTTLTGIVIAPFVDAFEEVGAEGLAGPITATSFGRERKWPSIFRMAVLSLALIQPTLPVRVFTINHFSPPGPVISPIGESDSPSLMVSTSAENSSGAANTMMSTFWAGGGWLDAVCPARVAPHKNASIEISATGTAR
jgi:hypothetical protein